MKGSIHGSRNEFVYRISIAKKANYPIAVHSIGVDSLIDVYGIKSLGDLRDCAKAFAFLQLYFIAQKAAFRCDRPAEMHRCSLSIKLT